MRMLQLLCALLISQQTNGFMMAPLAPGTIGDLPNPRTSSSSSNSVRSSMRLGAARKDPLKQVNNFLESASAKVMDYLFMQPSVNAPPGMRRVRTQFIAALGNPKSSSSLKGAEQWGIWRVDPGPRGVFIVGQDKAFQGGTRAPAGWDLDPQDFWIEEYGRIMEKPDFPVPPGRFLVTGGRQLQTILTVGEPQPDGTQSWSLGDGTLYDVTHLPCRSARYRPERPDGTVSPRDANPSDYPVQSGGEMPPIPGCQKQDYAVLFVLAVENDSTW